MVTIKITAGLANSIYEYLAGYYFAKGIEDDFQVDVSVHNYSTWTYLLDLFNIPATGKVNYSLSEKMFGSCDISDVHPDIIKTAKVLSPIGREITNKGEITDYTEYKGLDFINDDIKETGDTVLMGFFSGEQYWKKDEAEIRSFFELKDSYREIEAFNKLINNHISVGVHIRRGDMEFADFAKVIPDEYYKGAIEWFRKRYKNPIFCIFSDDKEYAKDLLGNQKDIFYIDFIGYDEGDAMEFYALSKCDHRVLNNNSTFSALADFFNGKKGRCAIRYKLPSKDSIKIRCNHFLYDRFSRYINPVTKVRDVRLTMEECKKYSNLFDKNKTEKDKEKYEIIEFLLETKPDRSNCEDVLNKLSRLQIDAFFVNKESYSKLLYIKTEALFLLGEYKRALGIADYIYPLFKDDEGFNSIYVELLSKNGCDKELSLEKKQLNPKKGYILKSSEKNGIYSNYYRDMKLADALGRMGYETALVYDLSEASKADKYYFEKSKGKSYSDCRGRIHFFRLYDKAEFDCMDKEKTAKEIFKDCGIEDVVTLSEEDLNNIFIKFKESTEVSFDARRMTTERMNRLTDKEIEMALWVSSNY